jgi:putative heme iron utilization protein
MSHLAFHAKSLQSNPACSLLIGEPPAKGDALAFARMTIQANAAFLSPQEKAELRPHFLKTHPKAQLYIDLADFHFVRFEIESAFLNGGFGKAFVLTSADLEQKSPGVNPGFW